MPPMVAALTDLIHHMSGSWRKEFNRQGVDTYTTAS